MTNVFRPKECNFIENKLKQKYSPLGDLVKDFSINQIITFEKLQADAFLYI